MSRGIHADVVTELAKDSFNMAHLVTIDFSTTVNLTDYRHDLVENSVTYSASSYLLGMGGVSESTEAQVGSINIQLSGVGSAYVAILLSENYIDRKVSIKRVLLDDSGVIIGDSFLIYEGRIDGYSIEDTESDSVVVLAVASHWADFSRVNGRRTNDNSQQAAFNGDLGMEFASEIIKDIKWGRK